MAPLSASACRRPHAIQKCGSSSRVPPPARRMRLWRCIYPNSRYSFYLPGRSFPGISVVQSEAHRTLTTVRFQPPFWSEHPLEDISLGRVNTSVTRWGMHCANCSFDGAGKENYCPRCGMPQLRLRRNPSWFWLTLALSVLGLWILTRRWINWP